MTRIRLWLVLVALLLGSVPAGAQEGTPRMASFAAGTETVTDASLANRTARIPVSWVALDRTAAMNLYFEQVLPDGSVVNVELPRLIPWVASSGDGIAAPIAPPTGTKEIVLRVSLRHLITGETYDSRTVTLTIVPSDVPGTGDETNNLPALTTFDTGWAGSVARSSLENGSARIDVSWRAINRPVTANLVFEQVLADGTAVNVELPRSQAWISSEGVGVVAPVLPGGDNDTLRLRVRLVDLVLNRTYDQKYITLPISTEQERETAPPDIVTFAATITSITDVEAGDRVRVPVQWDVQNRPSGTNLVFEQVLSDGSTRNAELPRDVVLVPSAGMGVMELIVPDASQDRLTLQLRVVRLSDGASLDTRRTLISFKGGTVPLPDNDPPDNDSAALAITSFSITPQTVDASSLATASVDVTWRTRGASAVTLYIENTTINLRNLPPEGNQRINLGEITPLPSPIGFLLVAQDDNSNSVDERRELTINSDTTIKGFASSVGSVPAGETVTLNWSVTGEIAKATLTWLPDANRQTLVTIAENLAATGSYSLDVPPSVLGERSVTLSVTDNAGTTQTAQVTLDVVCGAAWAFTAAEGCPVGSAEEVGAAFQRFQNGSMVWVDEGAQGRIFVLYDDGTGTMLADRWNGAALVIEEAPPNGMLAPARGFGYAWLNTPQIRQRLGWAINDEQSYRTAHQWQRHADDVPYSHYFAAVDGRIIAFTYDIAGANRWRVV